MIFNTLKEEDWYEIIPWMSIFGGQIVTIFAESLD